MIFDSLANRVSILIRRVAGEYYGYNTKQQKS